MKITIGEWKTRDGRKAIVGAKNKQALACDVLIGWLDGDSFSWSEDGSYYCPEDQSELDLIAPWEDPVVWDWSTTPPWLNCIVKGPSGQWYLCEDGVSIGTDGLLFNGAISTRIPVCYSPEWSGDWKQSKTMRPGYKK